MGEVSHVIGDAAARKATPIFSGVLMYFPDALAEVARVSKAGNDQHNPGQPLHWAKEKSKDEPDALVRHLLDAGKRDTDGQRHSAKVAWRALALLQREIERERAAVEGKKPWWDEDPPRYPAETRNGRIRDELEEAERARGAEEAEKARAGGFFEELDRRTGTPGNPRRG